MVDFSFGSEFADEKFNILVDLDGFTVAIRRTRQCESIRLGVGERLLRIIRFHPFSRREHPYLQEMNRLAGGIVELTVGNTRSRRNPLHFACFHHSRMSHAIFVLKRAADNIADDLEIAVWMRPKPLTTLHA